MCREDATDTIIAWDLAGSDTRLHYTVERLILLSGPRLVQGGPVRTRVNQDHFSTSTLSAKHLLKKPT